MIAGPNGSGKSTLEKQLGQFWRLGYFLNADELEKKLSNDGFVNLADYQLSLTQQDWEISLKSTNSIATKIEDKSVLDNIAIEHNIIVAGNKKQGSYFSALIIEFLRKQLLKTGQSFTFETVMSHPSKVKFLQEAKEYGFKTYLYFIGTDSVETNINRVKARFDKGGHNVSEKKIRERYTKSLELLSDAVKNADRAYVFDNSENKMLWLAEFEKGKNVQFKTDAVPQWFDEYLLRKI